MHAKGAGADANMTHVIAAAAKANFGGALERRHRAPDEYSYSPRRFIFNTRTTRSITPP
jgi:hypothetical protein